MSCRRIVAIVLLAVSVGCDKQPAASKKPAGTPGAPVSAATPAPSAAGSPAATPQPIASPVSGLDAAPLVGAKTDPARIQISRLVQGAQVWRMSHEGQWPATLEDLVPGGVKDPWGTPYLYRVVDDKPVIRSAGPDRIDGTADDIR